MSVIKIRVDDQQIALTNMPVIASGGIEENQIEFEFSSDWAGFACVAVFYRENKSYESIVSATGVANVPYEVTATDGKMWLGVMGVKNGVTKTSELVFYKILEGAITQEFDPGEPTPDIYNQILDYVSGVVDLEQRLIVVENNSSKNTVDIATQTGRINNMIASQQNESVTTLWTGTLDTKNQSVTLSESIANFDFIDIYCGGTDSIFSRKPVANTIHFELQEQNMSDDASSQFLRWWETGLTISGTTATIDKCIKCYWDDFSQVPVVSQATDGVQIIRIDGVKIGHIENDEIVDARVDFVGDVYSDLGNAIRNQVSQMNDSSLKLANGLTHIDESLWTKGFFSTNGVLDDTKTHMITTNVDLVFSYPICIGFKDTSYQYGIWWKMGDDVYEWSSWMNVDGFVIPSNHTFRLSVWKAQSYAVANVAAFVRKLLIDSKYYYYTRWLLVNREYMVTKGRELVNISSFRRGSLSNGNFATWVKYRIATVDVVRYDRLIKIEANSGFRFAIQTVNENDEFVADLGWFTSKNIEANQGFKMIIARVAASEDTSEVANVFDFCSQVSIQTKLLDYIEDGDKTVKTPLLLRSIFDNGRAKLIAHTGYHANYPENTNPAFEAAGKLGYWGIESDLQQTSDGYYVMCHDPTVDRTTDGSGNISNMTLAQVRALHIKDHSTLQIPTFEEYLSICKRYGCVPVIELKSTIVNSKENIESIIGIVKKFGFTDNSVIFTGSKWIIGTFKSASNDVAFMPVYQYGFQYDWDTEFASVSSYDNVGIEWDILDTITFARAEQCHNKGMLYGAFTIDNTDVVKSVFEAGVDFVTTNTVLPTD